MKILLLEDVKKLGKKGEIVEVSDGYARNYIMPKNLGKEATKEVVNEWSIKKKSEARRKEQGSRGSKGSWRRLSARRLSSSRRNPARAGVCLAPSHPRISRKHCSK